LLWSYGEPQRQFDFNIWTAGVVGGNAHVFCRRGTSIFQKRVEPPVGFELTGLSRNCAVLFLDAKSLAKTMALDD
jgi:hypothetical protein